MGITPYSFAKRASELLIFVNEVYILNKILNVIVMGGWSRDWSENERTKNAGTIQRIQGIYG